MQIKAEREKINGLFSFYVQRAKIFEPKQNQPGWFGSSWLATEIAASTHYACFSSYNVTATEDRENIGCQSWQDFEENI